MKNAPSGLHRHDNFLAASREPDSVSLMRRLVLRALVAVVLATITALAPLPWWTPIWFTHFQVPMVVFLFIATLGVLLYDTFFYDRYRN